MLRENLAKHQAVFDEALSGYKLKVVEVLEKKLTDARAGRRIEEYIRIEQPVNQTHEYKRAIGMLEMSVDEDISLTTEEYENYVLDRWRWKADFLVKNAQYSVTAALLAESGAEEIE